MAARETIRTTTCTEVRLPRRGRRNTGLLLVMLSSLVLTGCAGGDNPDSAAPTTPTTPTDEEIDGGTAEPTGETTTANEPREAQSLRYSIASLAAYTWPTFVASELGLWEKCGIDFELIVGQGGGSVLQAVLGGGADLGAPASDQAILAMEEGADLVGVSAESQNVPFTLMTQPDVDSFEDLRGGTFAVSTLQGGNSGLLREMLQAEGMTEGEDYQLVAGGGNSERAAGIQSGQYAGTLVSQPQDFQLEDAGLQRFAVTTDYVDEYQFGMAVGETEWVEQNRDLVLRFLRARLEAEEWLKDPSNREEAARILSDVTDTEMDVSLATYDLYQETDLTWVEWSVEGIQATLDTYTDMELRPAETYLDLTLVDEARELGNC